MKILYTLSQQPGNTGSGVYLKWISYEAIKRGYETGVLIGVNKDFNYRKELNHIPEKNIFPLKFETGKLSFPVPGMSDVMPYRSTKFRDMDFNMLELYKECFKNKLLEIKEKFYPDIIHSNHLWILTSIIKDIFPETPLIATCHGTELRQKVFCPDIADNIKNRLKKIDLIIALTERQKIEILDWLEIDENRIKVFGSGYSNEIFKCENKNLPENEIVISYAGKISKAKGVPYLIKAFQLINPPENVNIKLYLAGGYDTKEGREIVNSVNDNRIKFLGNLNQNQLAELFRNSHIFILPSFFEGLPLVVIEALACGCGVIVTELENLKEWFDEDLMKLNAVKLVPIPPLKNVDEISEEYEIKFIHDLRNAIEKFIDDYLKKNIANINEIAKYVEKHSYSNLFSKLEEEYKKLIFKFKSVNQ